MKKTIGTLLAMLMFLPFAFAWDGSYSKGCYGTVCQDKTPFGVEGLIVFHADINNVEEVAVCTNPEKNKLDVFVTVKNSRQYASALTKAQELFNSVNADDFGYGTRIPSPFYGCVRMGI